MNEKQDDGIEALAALWTVGTTDLTERISAAIGASPRPADPAAELLEEIRALRREMEVIRQSNALLREELLRLRVDVTGRKVTRLAPYSPIESLVRLS